MLGYYGKAGKAWVDIKLRELVKAAGSRDGRPIDLQAVFLAPPFDRRKERFRSLSAAVYRQEGETFDARSMTGDCIVDRRKLEGGQGLMVVAMTVKASGETEGSMIMIAR